MDQFPILGNSTTQLEEGPLSDPMGWLGEDGGGRASTFAATLAIEVGSTTSGPRATLVVQCC
jgi:hypothetical protein